MSRPKAILIGNGANLTAGLKDSWESVVRETVAAAEENDLEPRMLVTPFPLVIESAFGLGPDGVDEADLQKRLAARFDKWEPGEIHRTVAAANVSHILTTNWDLMLERSLGKKVVVEKPHQRERRYSLFRRNALPDGKRVWHIHGSAQVPSTMVLGFEHYAGSLAVLREVMVGTREWKNTNYGPIAKMDLDSLKDPQSWLEVALTHDLLVIGLRLDFAELDLWWFLTYRARMLRRSGSRFPTTKIVYACRREDDPTGRYQARKQQLEACEVEHRDYDCPWPEVYERALDEFV